MRRLWPEPSPVDDIGALVAAEPRPAPAGRPWLLVNMVTSLDGAIAVEGRSGGLAGPADKAMFHALRAVADVILVGAGTARAERYGPPRPRDGAAPPRLAIVTRSLALDLGSPLFAPGGDALPPIVITCAAAHPARVAATEEVAEVLVAGDDTVDLGAALADLAGRGAGIVTCEGGPHLNGDLLAADLVDEWDLTVSPRLVGGDVGRASHGPAAPPRAMRLDRVLEDDGFLLTRWVRER